MSEIINIPLGGVSNEPSDYIAEDGALSVSINTIKHNGSLRPLMPGTEVGIPLPKGADVVAIHEVGNMKHYILVEEINQLGTKAPAVEPRIYIYYTNLEGSVEVWWNSNKPEDFEGAKAWVGIRGYNERLPYNTPIKVSVQEPVYSGDITLIGIVNANGANIDIYQYKATIREIVADPSPDEEPTPEEEILPEVEPLPGDDPTTPKGKYVLGYIDTSRQTYEEIGRFEKPVLHVTAMGNVLTIVCENAPMVYTIWRDGKYTMLGGGLPELNCKAYLQTKVLNLGGIGTNLGISFESMGLELYDSNKTEMSGKIAASVKANVPYTSEMQAFVYDKVFGIVNSVHNAMMREGLFYAPFYMRMAYRMFDGTHVMHTPPKLMMVNSAGHPFFKLNNPGDGTEKAILEPFFPCSKLNVEIPAIDNKWKDLITDIDIFVTPPIVNYTDSPESIEGTKEIGYDYAISQQSEDAMRSVFDFPSDGQDVYISDFVAYKDVWYYLPANLQVADKAFIVPQNPDDFDIEGYQSKITGWGKDTKLYYDDTEGGKYVTLGELDLPQWLKTKLARETVTAYRAKQGTKFEYNKQTKHVTYIGLYKDVESAGMERAGTTRILSLQRADQGTYETELVDENKFFRIKSIPLADVMEGWAGEVTSKEDSLENLVQQQDITDNGQSRSKVITSIKPTSYNSRMSIVVNGISMPTTNAMDYFVSPPWHEGEGDSEKVNTHRRKITRAWVKGVINTQTVYHEIEVSDNAYADGIRQFYYPDYEGTQLVLAITNYPEEEGEETIYSLYTYNLRKHKLLNGTYLFDGFRVVQPSEVKDFTSETELLAETEMQISLIGKTEAIYGNMVRVSSVANPFHFSEVNQVTLPSGKISGLSTTAKALSQGQFGAFPLYCFSDNGIWALEVSDTGTYSAKQPVSRAVCTNPDSITQTEGSVLFVTKRGLMSIEGSNVTCISEELHGHNITNALDQLNKVKQMAGMTGMTIPDHVEDWMQEARFLYDDKRQHLYAFREDDDLAYVYSLTDQAWGMMQSDMAHPLPSYTDALVVTREDENGKRKVVNMSENKNCGNTQKSLIVTRPLTIGVTDGYKTIEALVARGVLDKDDAKMVIWASNDLKTWAIVATSTTSWYRGKSGTPYKYYRIGLLLDWEDGDSINAISADITPRINNRMR